MPQMLLYAVVKSILGLPHIEALAIPAANGVDQVGGGWLKNPGRWGCVRSDEWIIFGSKKCVKSVLVSAGERLAWTSLSGFCFFDALR